MTGALDIPTYNPATGLIELRTGGGLSEEQVGLLFDALEGEIRKGREAGRPLLLLVLADTLDMSSLAARRLAGKRARGIDIDKAAVVSSDTISTALTKLISRAAGIRSIIEFFKTEEEAREWLKG